ncbi:MAG: SDR family NAD(P)-dependent oxidoreductase [Akkermansiaceae bacterium]
MSSSSYQCVLITGASSGLGAEFARQLAPVSDSLILVARRAELLDEIAAEIKKETPDVCIHCLQSDLVDDDQRQAFLEAVHLLGLDPDLLINNAGIGDYGDFVSSDWQKVEAMMRLNMETLTHMTHAMLPGMISRRQGAVINVSSLASILPIPDFAVYAATKAYVTSFSEALRIEMMEHGIRVLALCPGPVHTGFGQVAQRGEPTNVTPGGESVYVDPKQVVREAIFALQNNKARHYPGSKIRLMAALMSSLPVWLMRRIMSRRPRRRASS